MNSEMPSVRDQMFKMCTTNKWTIIDQNIEWRGDPYRYAIQMHVVVDGEVGILATDWESDTITLNSVMLGGFEGKTFEKLEVEDE